MTREATYIVGGSSHNMPLAIIKNKESLKNYPSKANMIKLAKTEIKEWQKFLRQLTNPK